MYVSPMMHLIITPMPRPSQAASKVAMSNMYTEININSLFAAIGAARIL